MTNPSTKKWEFMKDEISTLAKTMTTRQISEHYKLTRRHMANVLQRLSITPARSADIWNERRQDVLNMSKDMTISEMAEHYGISADGMRRVVKRLGIECVSGHGDLAKTREYKALLAELGKTMNTSQIARHLGKDMWYLRYYMKKHGIAFQSNGKREQGFWANEKSVLIELIESGLTTNEIAAKYSTTPKMMRSIFARNEIKMKQKRKPESEQKTKVKAEKKQSNKKVIARCEKKATQVKQTKDFSFEKKPVQIVFPESVKIQVIKPNTCNDWRNAMARAPLSSFKETSWRY